MSDDLPQNAVPASGEIIISLGATAASEHTLSPPTPPTLTPEAGRTLSHISSLFTCARDFTRYLYDELPNVPAALAPHTGTILGIFGLGACATWLYHNEREQSRANVQLAIFHILRIIQMDRRYGTDVFDENGWKRIQAMMAYEVRRAVEAHHLSRNEANNVIKELHKRLWNKDINYQNSLTGEYHQRASGFIAAQKEDEGRRQEYLLQKRKDLAKKWKADADAAVERAKLEDDVPRGVAFEEAATILERPEVRCGLAALARTSPSLPALYGGTAVGIGGPENICVPQWHDSSRISLGGWV